MARQALRETPRVDEYERCPVFINEFGEPIIDLGPDFVRHDGFQWRSRQLQAQIALADMAIINYGALPTLDAGQKIHH